MVVCVRYGGFSFREKVPPLSGKDKPLLRSNPRLRLQEGFRRERVLWPQRRRGCLTVQTNDLICRIWNDWGGTNRSANA